MRNANNMTYSTPHSRRDSDRKYRRRQENLALLEAEKLARGCQWTGRMLAPEHLEWHHVGRKTRPLTKMVRQSRESMLQELKSCLSLGRDIHRYYHTHFRGRIPCSRQDSGLERNHGETDSPGAANSVKPLPTGLPWQTQPTQ